MSPDSELELDSLHDRSDPGLFRDSLDARSDSALLADSLDAAAADGPLPPPPRWLQPRRSLARRLLAAPFSCCPSRPRPRRLLVFALPVLASLVYSLVCLARDVPLLAHRLPSSHSGPHAVGAVDVEVAVSAAPRSVTFAGEHVRFRHGPPAFELETLLLTLYYPAETPDARADHHFWLPRPIDLTAAGYARFAHADFWPVRLLMTLALWTLVGSLRIPAAVDAPLLPARDDALSRLPVIVFSHGMASSRTDYTHYLSQLASRGFVVAALEHRDGSCPGTLVKAPGKPDRRLVHFGPDDVVMANTTTASPDDRLAAFKRHQLAFRTAEVAEAVALLRRLDDGDGAAVRAANARAEGSSLPPWRRRLALDRLVVAGHSYGATGALQALGGGEHPDLAAAAAGIVLDPGKESGPLNDNVSVPLLVIHSDSWSRVPSLLVGRPHFATVRRLVAAVLDRTRHALPARRAAAWFLTSLGTAHPSVSDAPLIEPLLLRWATRTTLDAAQALRQYADVSVAFLDALASPAAFTGLLAQQPTHREYGVWVNQERQQSFPRKWAGLWEIHVSPPQDE